MIKCDKMYRKAFNSNINILFLKLEIIVTEKSLKRRCILLNFDVLLY